MVSMWMWSCGQAKFFDQNRMYQVVAASSVKMTHACHNDNMKQLMAMHLLCFLHFIVSGLRTGE
jgi:hypothetical protein